MFHPWLPFLPEFTYWVMPGRDAILGIAMPLPLELPTIQNWSCHNCGGCCRQHAIAITAEEHERIAAQNWTAEEGIPAGQPLFERVGLFPWTKWYRLAHQPDGACVFLDERGLCRIHAKFGEQAKPLACRVYPYAFHPAGKKITVSLRFSCPSVAANRGTSLVAQQHDLATARTARRSRGGRKRSASRDRPWPEARLARHAQGRRTA